MSIIDDLKTEYRVAGIVQRLIFWNVGLFVIPMIVFSILSRSNVDISFLRWDVLGTADWFSLSSNPQLLLWKPWSLIGYSFLHASFTHILFNMLMLFFAGKLFLTFFTQKQLFGVYILSAIFAGAVFILGYQTIPALIGFNAKMVGASASIMAILVATAVYAPTYSVRLLLIGTVKLWHIAIAFVVLDLIYASAENTGGHIAHLAGALFGFAYIKLLGSGTDVTRSISVVTESVSGLFKSRKEKPFRAVHRNPVQSATKTSRTTPKSITQKQIDDILDKISRSGYDSLNKEEKDFLFKVGK